MTKAYWQGLTSKEIERLAIWADEHGHGPFHTDFALAIERLLMEKNLCSDINQIDSVTSVSEDEPVAWGLEHPNGDIIDVITPEEHAKKEGQYTVALYREPQHLQTWVGLDHEEIDYQAKKDDHGFYFALGALWAEVKLKDKNT